MFTHDWYTLFQGFRICYIIQMKMCTARELKKKKKNVLTHF